MIFENHDFFEFFDFFRKSKFSKSFFSEKKKVFDPIFFFYDLEFFYTFDLAHPERLWGCMGSGSLHNWKMLHLSFLSLVDPLYSATQVWNLKMRIFENFGLFFRIESEHPRK